MPRPRGAISIPTVGAAEYALCVESAEVLETVEGEFARLTDLSAILGVTKQRCHQLAERGDFPVPAGTSTSCGVTSWTRCLRAPRRGAIRSASRGRSASWSTPLEPNESPRARTMPLSRDFGHRLTGEDGPTNSTNTSSTMSLVVGRGL